MDYVVTVRAFGQERVIRVEAKYPDAARKRVLDLIGFNIDVKPAVTAQEALERARRES